MRSPKIRERMTAAARVTHATIESLKKEFPGYSIGFGATAFHRGAYNNLVRVQTPTMNGRKEFGFAEEHPTENTEKMPNQGYFEIHSAKTLNGKGEPDALVSIGMGRPIIFVKKKNGFHEKLAEELSKAGGYRFLKPEIRVVGPEDSLSASRAADKHIRT